MTKSGTRLTQLECCGLCGLANTEVNRSTPEGTCNIRDEEALSSDQVSLGLWSIF